MLHFSKLKIFSIIFFVILGILFFLPNLFNSNLSFLPKKKIVLGLDLQGGSYLLLEIDNNPSITQKLQNSLISIRNFLKNKNIKINNLKISNKSIFFNVSLDEKEKIELLFTEKESEINP